MKFDLIHALQRVDHLFVVAGAQSGHNEALSFAACEQCRAVCTWQETCLANDVADLRQSCDRRYACRFHNVAAQNAGLKLLQSGTEVLVFELLFCQGCFDRVFGSGNSGCALLLVSDRIGIAHCVFASSLNRSKEISVVRCLEVERLFGAFFCQSDDQVDRAGSAREQI